VSGGRTIGAGTVAVASRGAARRLSGWRIAPAASSRQSGRPVGDIGPLWLLV